MPNTAALLQPRRQAFARTIQQLKAERFVRTDFQETLKLINDWFFQTSFDGVVFREEQSAKTAQPAQPLTPERNSLCTPVSSADVVALGSVDRGPRNTEAPSLLLPPHNYSSMVVISPCETISPQREDHMMIVQESEEWVSPAGAMQEKQLVVAVNSPGFGRRLTDRSAATESLFQAVRLRLSKLDSGNQYHIKVTAKHMLINHGSTGVRRVSLNAHTLLDVSETWVDSWDRQCVAALASVSGAVKLFVVDVVRAMILGEWTNTYPSQLLHAHTAPAGNGVVAVMTAGIDTQLHYVRLPDDECSTHMTELLACAVPIPNVPPKKWRVAWREGAVACALELANEKKTVIGDIYSSGRSLWYTHSSSLKTITEMSDDIAIAELSVEAVASLLSFLIAIERKDEFLKLLLGWLSSVPEATAVAFLRFDLLRAWQPSGLLDGLKKITATRWRSELLKQWGMTIPILVCDVILPKLTNEVTQSSLNVLHELMDAVEKHYNIGEQKIQSLCSEFINNSSSTPALDVVLEAACLRSQQHSST